GTGSLKSFVITRPVLFLTTADLYLVLLSFPTRRSSDLISNVESRHFHRRPVPARGCDLRPASHAAYRRIRRAGESDAGVCGVLSDRKSTRLNSSHVSISYAVFCLKKKNVMTIKPDSQLG